MDPVDARLADAGAVLVDDRILRRVIKRHRRLRGVGLQVPHAECYALPRAELARLVQASEVQVAIDELPERVVVIRGAREAIAGEDPRELVGAWRRIFHGRVHEAFDALLADHQLTASAIRERIGRIGQTEIDEVRSVLRQADLLLPPLGDTATYVEFVALYLELKYFARDALAKTFPTLGDSTRVDEAIALDIDPDAIFAASRPAGAPSLDAREPAEQAPALPAEDQAARAAARELVGKLSRALAIEAPSEWEHALARLATVAAPERRARFSASARLWHDLRAAAAELAHDVKVIDFVGFALTLGRRKLVRSLPATREVRIAKHVHVAQRQLAHCELPAHDRDQLGEVLEQIAERADERVRGALRPRIEAALDQVGLVAHDLVGRVARDKLVGELLDKAVASGRLNLGDLRDALSKSQLKMRDLRARDLLIGDALLRADRVLARSLDGVYRGGEVYMRGLQKISSLLFGTAVGRVLSLYVLLPVLGAFTLVEGAQHVVGPLAKLLGFEEPELATTGAFAGTIAFLFLLIHAPLFRRGVAIGLRLLGRGLRLLLFELPRRVWALPSVRRLRESRVWRLVVGPAIPAAIVAPSIGGRFGWPVAGAVFVAAELLANSRAGRIGQEIIGDWLVRSGRQVARHIVPGVVKAILDIFAGLVELLDRGIYRVDEWLRFRSGESTATLVIKAALAPLWRFVTYFLRLYVNLFIEPVVNPIKHFPVVTVAAKLLLPFSPTLIRTLRHSLRAAIGHTLAAPIAAFTVFVIPGFAGFLVWEFKENWKLYAATRPDHLREVAIGHHAESMVGLMKPGFHSGTIPKLYTKLRRAAWKGDERALGKARVQLHHVEEAICRFAERELVALLQRAPAFGAPDLAVADVAIASNRVVIELACPSLGAERAAIAFEEQSGWLLAHVRARGWIGALSPERREALENALAGFYKLAGVDLVREQLENVLGDAPYDVSEAGLVVWPGEGYTTEVHYDLRSRDPRPHVTGPAPLAPLPAIASRHARFGREPLAWSAWVDAWVTRPPPRIAVGPRLVRDA